MPRNLIGGLATVAIGVAYLVMALGIRTSALADSVGPAGFPKVLAYALIGLGLVLCAQSLYAMRARRAVLPGRAAAGSDPGSEAESHDNPRGVLRAAGMLGLGIAYLLIIRYLGYVVSVALLMVASALYLGIPLSWRVFAIGAAGALVYWLLFVWILGIPQPPGLLGRLF